jgi:sulfur carrier protein
MEILLNGESFTIDQTSNIHSLIKDLNIEGKFAIEINKNIIPRSEYDNTKLQPGDEIEIIQAIGGG